MKITKKKVNISNNGTFCCADVFTYILFSNSQKFSMRASEHGTWISLVRSITCVHTNNFQCEDKIGSSPFLTFYFSLRMHNIFETDKSMQGWPSLRVLLQFGLCNRKWTVKKILLEKSAFFDVCVCMFYFSICKLVPQSFILLFHFLEKKISVIAWNLIYVT